ncbi:MAG: lipopolysaccharide transport periplasmic protein LptA [Chromatiales bacterium]|nr:lipopolysaccharide transport periplasmic protein LptA [Chromatiales bacterium]
MSSSNSIPAVLLLLAASLVTPQAQARADDTKQPIELAADSAEIDDKTKVSVYRGNVVLKQGSIRIEADRLEVHGARGETDRIIATGNPVTFYQEPDKGVPYRGRAQRAEFDRNSDILTLIDQAVITQGDTRMASDRIAYDRGKATLKAGASAEGKNRVQITLPARTAADATKP